MSAAIGQQGLGANGAGPADADAAAATVAAAATAAPPLRYVGLVTRAIAFGIDCAIVDVVAIVVAALVALTFSVLSLPDELKVLGLAAGGVAYALWAIGYFVTFWSTTGQTPGSRVMRIRVRPRGGEDRLLPRRSLVRFAGLVLAAIPFFAGFLLILIDDRRRGLHDRLARTVVIEAGDRADAAGRAAPPQPAPR